MIRMTGGFLALAVVHAAAGLSLAPAAGCSSPVRVENPMGTLANPADGPRRLAGAMEALDADPTNEAYLKALREIIWRPLYVVSTREAAFDRLLVYDEPGLKRTIRLYLPRMGARAWQERLFELIVEHGWSDLGPAIVSAWARPIPFVEDFDRAEYHALVKLYGSGNVIDVVFALLIEATGQPFLRVRCWELLTRLGQGPRLVALLADETIAPDDQMLTDLRAVAVELGAIPRNREEILWARKLCEPSRAEFFAQAAAAVRRLPDSRRGELELRDLPVIVAADLHDSWLADADKQALYERVEAELHSKRTHIDPDRFQGFPGSYPQRLYESRDELTWGDLAALLMAIRAMEVPEVAAHLFSYADRDREDKSCEYGGIIRLDDRGRFEIIEFPPRFRRRDNEFIASQQMMDAAYTALFQFHLHAQKYDNERYAGPGMGDVNYADNTRANCLVFTFINRDTLNIDYYRYDAVIVDLGEIERP